MKINCIIVDDEPESRDIMKTYISDIDALNLVAECKNALEANEVLKKENIQLMFLDINMPKITGLQFLKSLAHKPKVIFTTAYPQYAIEGFELDAIDYLLKPFSFERFLKAFNKFSTLEEKTTSSPDPAIILKANKKLYRVPVNEIRYLEAVGDYVKVVFGEQTIMVHSTFQDLLEQLSHPGILRIHRSFAVAIDKFEYIDGNQIFIGKKALPIGKAFRSDLISRIGEK